LKTRQDVVVDDTNPTPDARTRYAVPALEAGFKVVCCLPGDSAQDALVPLSVAEGVHEIVRARPGPAGGWVIEPIAPPAVLRAAALSWERAARRPGTPRRARRGARPPGP
jgi:hypothetical protein